MTRPHAIAYHTRGRMRGSGLWIGRDGQYSPVSSDAEPQVPIPTARPGAPAAVDATSSPMYRPCKRQRSIDEQAAWARQYYTAQYPEAYHNVLANIHKVPCKHREVVREYWLDLQKKFAGIEYS